MQKPIGIFDSGFGGVSVLAEALKKLPEEDYIYYGDLLYAPYGTKTREEIQDRSAAVAEVLLVQGCKAIVIACNTATSTAAVYLRGKYTLPIIGMEPALKPAVEGTTGSIVVLATPLTIKESKFKNQIGLWGIGRDVRPVACPGLMELVEREAPAEDVLRYLEELVGPHISADTEALVLGCTHYIYIKPHLERLWPQIKQFDGNVGAVQQLKRRLTEENLAGGGSGHVVYKTSAAAMVDFAAKCERFKERALQLME